jgi:hypothetical protein
MTRRSPYCALEEGASVHKVTPERSGFYKVHHSCDNGRQNDPDELVPVEKRDTCQLWVRHVVKSGPTESDKRDNEKQEDGMELLL